MALGTSSLPWLHSPSRTTNFLGTWSDTRLPPTGHIKWLCKTFQRWTCLEESRNRMLSNPESGLLRWTYKKFQDPCAFALHMLLSWLLVCVRCRQQAVRCILKVWREFLIAKYHLLVVGTLKWDSGKLDPILIQIGSFDYKNCPFLISHFHPLPSSSFETAGRRTLDLDPVTTGLGELKNFWVGFGLWVFFRSLSRFF